MDTRLNNVVIIEFQRVPRVVAGDEQFVQLFTRPDADGLLFAIRTDCGCEIGDSHRRNLRDEYLASSHDPKASLDKTRAVLKPYPKSGHAWIGDRQLAVLS